MFPPGRDIFCAEITEFGTFWMSSFLVVFSPCWWFTALHVGCLRLLNQVHLVNTHNATQNIVFFKGTFFFSFLFFYFSDFLSSFFFYRPPPPPRAHAPCLACRMFHLGIDQLRIFWILCIWCSALCWSRKWLWPSWWSATPRTPKRVLSWCRPWWKIRLPCTCDNGRSL